MTYKDRVEEAERLLPQVIDLYTNVKEKGDEYYQRYEAGIERESGNFQR